MKKYLLLLFFYLLSVNLAFAQKDAIDGKSYIPVSYTHLTLPTILRV